MSRRVIDLTGQKFSRLTVLERAGSYQAPNGNTTAQWLCKCDCGETKVIITGHLRSGSSKSCGCLRTEISAARFAGKKYAFRHGQRQWSI